ncbi:cell division protein FtsQ/DivIB [Xanthobacter autotrophicus DSM 431]|uniref:cell division protein FtsQ/DivIB n=1 Tax=Xanthobacter nonsaccharivorans TaxID=3119912 RepID=UPI00372C33A3
MRPRPGNGGRSAQRPVPAPPPGRHKRLPLEPRPASRTAILLRRLTVRLGSTRLGRRSASLLALAVVGGFSVYGIVLGGHVEAAKEIGLDVADAAGNVAGFKVKEVNISGHNHVTPAEILEAAGIKSSTSILFVNADETRARLEQLPWIQSASVRKFYPDRIDISIAERQAFALWQSGGEIRVIARDGTPIAPYSDDSRYLQLPIVVGEGAEKRVGDIVDALARLPALRDQVRAAILVAERRWTLKMRNGIDVRLPETGMDEALVALMDLDRDKKLLSRDITIIDLRLPDRVVVRLSDAAADARAQMLKARAKAKKGGPA